MRRLAAVDAEYVLYLGASASAIALVVAHFAPWGVARSILSAAFVLWVLASVAVVAVGARRAVRSVFAIRPALATGLAWGAITLAIVFGAMRDIQLGMLQTYFGQIDLNYNIDHRFIHMHAWSILRSGGLGETLSMLGQPISYHTGPSWYAGALGSLLDADPRAVVYLWFPIAALVTIVVASARILRSFDLPRVAVGAGVAFALTPSWSHVDIGLSDLYPRARYLARSVVYSDWVAVGHIVEETVLNASPTQMLNALLGTAIVLAALGFVVRNNTTAPALTVAAVVIALAMAAKPQYVAAGPPMLLAVGLAGARNSVRRAAIAVCLAAASAVGGLLLTTRLLFSGPGLIEARIAPDGLAWPVAWRAVRPFLPTQPPILLVTLVVASLAALWFTGRIEGPHRRTLVALAVLLVSMLAFWFFLSVLVAGGDGLETWAWNAMTGLGPSVWFVTALSAAVIVSLLQRQMALMMLVIVGVVGLGAAASAHQFVVQVRDPLAGHEAVDASEIRELLVGVDPASARLLTSDLADPADDHARAGRAFYLSNVRGHQFWLTQTEYGHHLLDETWYRIDALDRFFGSDWSRWHSEFLWANSITHVIVNARCPAVWRASRPALLEAIRETESWTLFAVLPRSETWKPVLEGLPLNTPIDGTSEPVFGRASCR